MNLPPRRGAVAARGGGEFVCCAPASIAVAAAIASEPIATHLIFVKFGT
jgi:hypothetical protein